MASQFKGITFDVDGVLEYHGRPLPGAVETLDQLRQLGYVIRFLTNSTLKSRRDAAERLRQHGFHIGEDELITASFATAAYLRQLNPRSCWIMLEGSGLEEFTEFNQTLDDPEYLVIGDNRSRFDFAHLNQALRLLKGGAKLIGMLAELIDYSQGGLELNVGSWVGMLERASGVQATYIGKPHPYGFELTLQSMGLDRRQVVVVGDQLGTDILGARRLGLASILVRTGEFELRQPNPGDQPDFIVDSIAEILGILA